MHTEANCQLRRKICCKKQVIDLESCDKSTVTLLCSGEQHYIKAANNWKMSVTLSRPAVEPLATWYTVQHVANQPQTHQTLALGWGWGRKRNCCYFISGMRWSMYAGITAQESDHRMHCKFGETICDIILFLLKIKEEKILCLLSASQKPAWVHYKTPKGNVHYNIRCKGEKTMQNLTYTIKELSKCALCFYWLSFVARACASYVESLWCCRELVWSSGKVLGL